MSALELTCAVTINDRTRALLDGNVKPAGIDLLLSPMESAEIFWRQLEFGEFDVSEMSLSALSCIIANGNRDWLALPVFTMRRFYHTQLLVRADAGIAVPADLRGKRAGVPDYLQTSVVWARGILADEFGVQPSDLTWVMERDADRSLGGATGFTPPADLRFSHLRPDQSLDRMLLDGELDVLFHYITARNLVDRSRINLRADARVRPLFPDTIGESARYFQATGMYPVNHCVIVRRAVLERYPFVALNLFDAFQASAERVIVRGVGALETYVNAGLVAREVRDVMARDPWAYGISASKRELETLFRYLYEQGISGRQVTIDEVFAPATLGL
jgi:4,5-dihydroxyphthalate decarboxylase